MFTVCRIKAAAQTKATIKPTTATEDTIINVLFVFVSVNAKVATPCLVSKHCAVLSNMKNELSSRMLYIVFCKLFQ